MKSIMGFMGIAMALAGSVQAILVPDDFNRADTSAVTSNEIPATIGGDWIMGQGVASAKVNIERNRLHLGNASGTVLLNLGAKTLNGEGKRFRLSVTADPINNDRTQPGLTWNFQSPGNYYWLRYYPLVKTLQFFRVVDGVPSGMIGSVSAPEFADYVAGAQYRYTVVSSNAYEFYVTIEEIGTGKTASGMLVDPLEQFTEGYGGVTGGGAMYYDDFVLEGIGQTVSKAEVRNPYADIDWERDEQVCSTTHIHMTWLNQFYLAYDAGLRHFLLSNYYPSAPYYPLGEMRRDPFMVQQENAIVVHGELRDGPFHWNDIIMDPVTGWFDELPADVQQTLPLQVGHLIFTNLPSDIAASPNAEHHAFTNSRAHINAIGSFYASGSMDNGRKYQLKEHGYALGTELSWQEAFDQMLAQLQFPDGGGITINHPVWSDLSVQQVLEMLDHDERVLGIEIFNDTSERTKGTGYAIDLWDRILATGRRCYGFAVPDHHGYAPGEDQSPWKGRNHLWVPTFTEEALLKAYREGRFYCGLTGSGLRFEEVSLTNGVVSVRLNTNATIKIISDQGVAEVTGKNLSYKVPVKNENFALTYLRVEAEDGTGERLFSQPILFADTKQTSDTPVSLGAMIQINLAPLFSGTGLTYSAHSTDDDVGGEKITGDLLQVEALAVGAALISVAATDGAGNVQLQSFALTVVAADPPNLDLMQVREVTP